MGSPGKVRTVVFRRQNVSWLAAVRRVPTSSCHVASRPAYPAPHRCFQAPSCLERVGRAADRFSLSYQPPTNLHLVGKCTEAAKTCALSLRKELQPVLKLKFETVKINQGGFCDWVIFGKGILRDFHQRNACCLH